MRDVLSLSSVVADGRPLSVWWITTEGMIPGRRPCCCEGLDVWACVTTYRTVMEVEKQPEYSDVRRMTQITDHG